LTFVNKTNIEQIMASVINELVEELQAKKKRIDKEIINLDRSSVIPEHYNKAECICKLTDEAIKCEDRANYLLQLSHTTVANLQQG
jgi:hypothetical protein|tara:strand:+ start:365 stop:622 length:258 start_codon:yes stop_codon:yes gene_type:complete